MGAEQRIEQRMSAGAAGPFAGGLTARAMNRRDFLKLGGLGLAGVSMLGSGACGGGGGETSGDLRWSMWSASPEETAVWRELAQDVNEKHPNIAVKLETVTFEDYWNKLSTQLASENEADIVAMQAQRMPGFAARGALQPLQPFIDDDPDVNVDDFFDPIRKGLSVGEEIYAFGYDIGPILLYYNKNLFDKAGIPTPAPDEPISWEEFRQSATELTNAGAKEYGYVLQPVFDAMVPWLWSGGGDYMNAAETECTLNTPESIEAMEFVVSMFAKDKIAAPITDLANPNYGVETFYSGKVGMYTDGPWQFINIETNSNFEWGIAPMPAGPAGSVTWAAGSGFGISNTTESPDAAWDALKVITSTESLKKTAKAGRGYPARKSAVPAFEDPNAPPPNDSIVEDILTNKIAEARPFNTTTTWQETTVMLGRDFSPVFLGRRSVPDTIAKVKPQFDKLLQEHQEILEKQS
jgi:multiple sugar transport system substrate-binding protein